MNKKGQLLWIGIAVVAVLVISGAIVLFNDEEPTPQNTTENTNNDITTQDDVVEDTNTKADDSMNFFITSVGSGDGANLGGLEGADSHCQMLAESVGAGEKTWKAYLSTTQVNAKDRIGSGPWYNYEGVMIAESISELHSESNNLNKETGLNERGEVVNGRGDTPNRHDILTGSQLDGTRFTGTEDTTCNDWTSSEAGSARLGHHDRTGGGDYPESWNSAHNSRGCSQEDLQGTGGDGLFYCFATSENTNENEVMQQTPDKVFVLTGENFLFREGSVENPDLVVNQGDLVRIEFTSTQGFHDWVVDEFNAATSKVSDTDGLTYVEFVATEVGTFEYYCSVGSHRANGMKGNLVVE